MLRPYQQASLDAVVSKYRAGVRRQLIQSPTGSGKTVIFSHVPEVMRNDLHGQTLVLVHRDELIQQNAEKLRRYNPDLKVDIEQGEQFADPDADIIVASVATLGRKVSKRRQRFDWDSIRICVVDEAHHSTASTYRTILEEGGFLEDGSSKLLLGVTATPNRSDGTPLADIYQEIVFRYPLRQAITDGWLCDLTGFRVDTRTSLDAVHTVAGDFKQDELADTVNTAERNQLIVKTWMEHAANRQTIVFTVDIQHAIDLAAMFQEYGVNAEAVWGVDTKRADKIGRHKNGHTQVLTNCGVLIEGYDDPSIACVILARPTKSSLLFQQMIGRGTRLCEGKQNCLVLDVVDSSTRHSLATLPSLLGMPAGLNLKGRSAVASLKLLEETQREHPEINLRGLTDITQLTAFVERVELWREIQFAPEVEEHSKFAWHQSVDGGYVLLLPDRQKITITQNVLGQWELGGLLNGATDALQDAFRTADRYVREQTDYSGTVFRKAKWHGHPATEKQIATVRKLYKNKPLPANLSKGEAANLISAAIAQFS
jgi:ATP-dependent helicase IRC3